MKTLLPFLILGLVSGSVYGLAAVGLVLTYRTSGIFNFAHGTVAAVGAYAFYQLRDRDGLPWPVALVIAVLVAGPLMGLLLEVMARTLTNASIVARVVATVGVLVALQQLAVIRYGAATLAFPPFLPTRTFAVGGVRVGIDQLIVVVVAIAGTAGLSLVLRRTKLGLAMRGVVDNDSLTALTGRSPTAIRRWSWGIGCVFASLSGILIAPTLGLDAGILTLLVVQAFGAAAVGLFTSLPLAYVGGVIIGIGSAMSSKYVGSIGFLRGIPASLPFIVLFTVLVVAPRRRLIDIAPERRRPLPAHLQPPPGVQAILAVAGVGLLAVVPFVVGTKIIGYSVAMAYVVIFVSLVLLDRLSGQLSLAQLSFTAVGGTAFSHFAHGFGMPWLLAVVLGAVIAVPVGALLAIPAIRLSGLYLALASFGFGLLMPALFYGQRYMFGTGSGGVVAPRPSFAASDKAYYYVLLAFALGATGLLLAVRRAPLGRLLRAMADSPVALATQGMSVTAIKVIAFCVSAFLAGLGGALLGPVTGRLASSNLDTFASLFLVVVLALQTRLGDSIAAFAAAGAAFVVPTYRVQHQSLNRWLPVLFGFGAIWVAMSNASQADTAVRTSSARRDALDDRIRRSPLRDRVAGAAVVEARAAEATP
jgi:branched-subunit amino acid ABC-type transport system permease component